MSAGLGAVVNLPLLAALAARRKQRRAVTTGAGIELDLGQRKVVVHVCIDHVLRVGRDLVAALIGVAEEELGVTPPLMSVAEVRLILNCIRLAPETIPAARLLSALQGELRRAQTLVNFSGPSLWSALGDAPTGAVLTPRPRRVCR